jgi:hypothetical protein
MPKRQIEIKKEIDTENSITVHNDLDNHHCCCGHKHDSDCCHGAEDPDTVCLEHVIDGYADAYLNEEKNDVDVLDADGYELLDEDDVDLGDIHGECLIYPGPTGIHVDVNNDDVRSFNVGASDYSQHKIQPWDIWEEYNLNPWEADIVKRVLRKKNEGGLSEIESRIMDFEKIIHISRKCIELLEKKKNM